MYAQYSLSSNSVFGLYQALNAPLRSPASLTLVRGRLCTVEVFTGPLCTEDLRPDPGLMLDEVQIKLSITGFTGVTSLCVNHNLETEAGMVIRHNHYRRRNIFTETNNLYEKSM